MRGEGDDFENTNCVGEKRQRHFFVFEVSPLPNYIYKCINVTIKKNRCSQFFF